MTSRLAKSLARGVNPTWSPNGEGIAFRDHHTYYAVRPTGVGKRELFHKKKCHVWAVLVT